MRRVEPLTEENEPCRRDRSLDAVDLEDLIGSIADPSLRSHARWLATAPAGQIRRWAIRNPAEYRRTITKLKTIMEKIMTYNYDFLRKEPFDAYSARSKTHLTSHQIFDFMRRPIVYQQKRIGLIPDMDSSSSFKLGRAAHTRILEGRDEYECRYAIGGPVNPTTGKEYGRETKAFRAFEEEKGCEVLSESDAELIENLYAGVMREPIAAELLSDGVAEGVAIARFCGTDCQARIDFFNPTSGIVDLKTCSDIERFEDDAKKYGYIYQMAFYHSIVECVSGYHVPVHVIGVEKQKPHSCWTWRIPGYRLYEAKCELIAAIRQLHQAYENDVWETGGETVRNLM